MRVTKALTLSIAGGLALTIMGCARGERPDSEGGTQPAVEIVQPVNGASLAGPDVRVALAIEHVRLAPAGTNEPNTAHLHLFINRDLTPEGEVIPVGEGIVHLGQAQSEHTIAGMAPGEYRVIAVLGDWAHVRISGAITDTVRIAVR